MGLLRPPRKKMWEPEPMRPSGSATYEPT